jgi:hypothetical protein
MKKNRSILTKFDRLMAAAAFAEEGEFETAREILREGGQHDKRNATRPEIRKQQIRKSH